MQQTYNHENHRRPEPVTVKLMGPEGLVQAIVEHLEQNFYAIRTSDYMENRGGPGVHIFLKVAGVRE